VAVYVFQLVGLYDRHVRSPPCRGRNNRQTTPPTKLCGAPGSADLKRGCRRFVLGAAQRDPDVCRPVADLQRKLPHRVHLVIQPGPGTPRPLRARDTSRKTRTKIFEAIVRAIAGKASKNASAATSKQDQQPLVIVAGALIDAAVASLRVGCGKSDSKPPARQPAGQRRSPSTARRSTRTAHTCWQFKLDGFGTVCCVSPAHGLGLDPQGHGVAHADRHRSRRQRAVVHWRCQGHPLRTGRFAQGHFLVKGMAAP